MVASTPRPLSAFTRNIAFGSASWTMPSNSSLSPLGSFGPLDVLFLLRLMLGSRSEGRQHPRRDLFRLPDPLDTAQEALRLVVGEERRGHLLVSVEAFAHGFRAIVGTMLQIGPRGRGTIYKMIDLSSPFVGAAVDEALLQEMPRYVELNHSVQVTAAT